jgi:hypothetical protein
MTGNAGFILAGIDHFTSSKESKRIYLNAFAWNYFFRASDSNYSWKHFAVTVVLLFLFRAGRYR